MPRRQIIEQNKVVDVTSVDFRKYFLHVLDLFVFIFL